MIDASPTVWPAPAKLNLFLHVVGRRADGYHCLQTVFQIIDLADRVTLTVRSDGTIRRIDPLPGIDSEDDLCLIAARTLKRLTGCSLGVDIGLTKNIPIGGGLGGGSSDAATVLVALNELWGTGLTESELAGIAVQLGADVPVFVRMRSAWAEGIGDVLHPIALPERFFVVIHPGVQVATATIFAAPELTRNTPPMTIAGFLSGEPTRNDLEPVVRVRYREVDAALHWLSGYAPARMSGSGSCVFAVMDDQAQALAVASACPRGWRAFVARGVAQSPLRDAVLAYRAHRVG